MRRDQIEPALVLPAAGVDFPRLKGPVARYGELQDKLKAAGRELAALEASRQAAVDADRQALADARRAGKRDPGDEKVRAADAKIAAAHREIEGLQLAVNDQRVEVIDAVDENRAALAELLAKRETEARTATKAAVDALAAAHATLARQSSARMWLNTFPDARKAPVTSPAIDDLRKRSGDPFRIDEVIAALQVALDPVAEEPISQDQRSWRPTPADDMAGAVGG